MIVEPAAHGGGKARRKQAAAFRAVGAGESHALPRASLGMTPSKRCLTFGWGVGTNEAGDVGSKGLEEQMVTKGRLPLGRLCQRELARPCAGIAAWRREPSGYIGVVTP